MYSCVVCSTHLHRRGARPLSTRFAHTRTHTHNTHTDAPTHDQHAHPLAHGAHGAHGHMARYGLDGTLTPGTTAQEEAGPCSSHLSAAERSVHQVEQSGARTARLLGQAPPPFPQPPSPHTSGPDSIHRSSPVAHHHPFAPWPVLARWLARSLIAHGQMAPSPIVNAAACSDRRKSALRAVQGCPLWPAHKPSGCPCPKFRPNLGNFAPLLQSKRLNIQLTTSDAPFHMRTLPSLNTCVTTTSRISRLPHLSHLPHLRAHALSGLGLGPLPT